MARNRDLGKLPYELKGGAGKTILSKVTSDDYDFEFRSLQAGDMPTGIDAANIGAGGVSNTEFGYLDGVTSNIQTQINNAKGLKSGIATGTDTYAVTISGVTSYADGDAYLVRFTNGNTSSCTLNINSLGAKTLYRNNDGALIGGDIVAGGEMLCVYNASGNYFQAIGTAPNTLLSYVTNAESVTITKGQAVYAYGGQGDRMTVKLAYNTNDATSAQTVGIVLSASIGANQKGLIMMQGLLDGLNILPTSTFADGDTIYLGATAGSITNVKPYAPNHLVYLGVVTTSNNGNAGRMYVRVQNGYELDELHNVQAQSPTANDTLYYFGSNQWKTASIPTILGYTPQAALSGSGIVKSTAGTISYLTDNSTNWDTAYNDRLKWDGGATGLVAATGRTSLGLGTFAIANYPTWSSGTPFVKMTAAGTFSLDTATYLTGNQTITLSGDVSGSGTTGITTTIGANKVTLGMMSQASPNTILGNNTGSVANVSYLTGTQVTAMLNSFSTTTTTQGLVKGSNSVGNRYYLDADNNWSIPYTFSTGLTNTTGTITANLSTGIAGGQTAFGGTASGENLTLRSTTNDTKGKIILGSLSAYDELNDRLGIGITSPTNGLHIVKSSGGSIFVDSTASDTTACTINGTTTVTSGTTAHTQIMLTSSPATNSSAGSRSLFMRHLLNASGINFTASAQNGPTSAWYENRIINAGTITSILGAFFSGCLLGGDAASCGTVTNAVGIRSMGFNSFSNALTPICTNSRAFYAHNTAKGTATLTNQVGLNVEALTSATNNTAILLGTTSIPSGNFAIYSAGTETSYFAGSIQLVDRDFILSTGTGTKIGTATGQKIGFWNAAPIIQPTSAISTSITFTANTGTAINSASTFGGYTIIQVIQALKNLGIIA
jgi:hypothetical protein